MQPSAAKLATVISTVADPIIERGPLFAQLDINPIVFSSGRWTVHDA